MTSERRTRRQSVPDWTRSLAAPDQYISIKHPERGWILEHRWAMEQALGRPLRDDENVHHRDGNKHHNHPTNLEVVSSSLHDSLSAEEAQRSRWADFRERRAAMLARREAE